MRGFEIMENNNHKFRNIKTIETYIDTNQQWWEINQYSKDLLRDQLAFLFFADKKVIYTEEEIETLESVVTIVMTHDDKKLESVRVSLILRYDATIDNNVTVWSPIFRFKKLSSPKYYFMDNNMQVCEEIDNNEYVYVCIGYESLNETNGNSITSNTCVCFPGKNLRYPFALISNNPTCDDGKSPAINDLKKCFNNLTSTTLNEKDETVKRLLPVLIFKFTINSTFLEDIIEALRTQLETKIVDALLEGYREVNGETQTELGNAYFIKDILHIVQHSNLFEKIKLTINSFLSISKFLTLQSKAFVQLSEEEKVGILNPDSNQQQLKVTLKKYRFFLDTELVKAEQKISEELSKLEKCLLNDLDLLKGLRPFQIIRLYKILRDTFLNFNNTFIDLGIEIAKLLGITTFEKLDAVMEFAATLLHEKSSELKEEDDKRAEATKQKINEIKKQVKDGIISEDEGRLQIKQENAKLNGHNFKKGEIRCKIRYKRFERASEELRKELKEICNRFVELTSEYTLFSQGEKFNFADPMLAVSHYKKHGKDYWKNGVKVILTFQRYLQMARKMLSRKDIESTWEQDGSIRSFKAENKNKTKIAVRKNNIIATLFFAI
ncbi:uncharacterized protein LOC131952535 [Physella acuta]|uniref:uncharacterized protein LOC131952535 n=1 Tax=Physella acuta TaxID=109671 RepID=UPI0027DE8010|nr:uncharacterized protein LOC131952535 [Physella acuta]